MKNPTINKEVLSANLKRLVGDRSMSQIAREIGIGDVSFRNYVRGVAAPSASALKMIADYYKIPISKLLEANDNETKQKFNEIKESIQKLPQNKQKELFNWIVENL